MLVLNRERLTVVKAMTIVQVVTAKFWSATGVARHPAFMNSCLTISHIC